MRPAEPLRVAIAPEVLTANGVSFAGIAADCGWAPGMPLALFKAGEGTLLMADDPRSKDLHVVSIEIRRFDITESPAGREYYIGVRANVRYRGKLVGTRDLFRENDISPNKPVCPVLMKEASKLAEQVEDWLHYTHFAECGDGCEDIRPDEPIVMASVPLRLAPSSVNEAVGECGWEGVLTRNIVDKYERSRKSATDPAPLLVQAVDIQNYPGRKLVVIIEDVHVIGGGRFTGNKWMKLRGALMDRGNVYANFDWMLEDRGSYGACKTMLELSEEAGERIGEWLRQPTMDVRGRAGFLSFLKSIRPGRMGTP